MDNQIFNFDNNDIYKVRIKTIQVPKSEEITDKQVVMIVRNIKLDNKQSIDIPHPITSFIIDTCNSLNTQKKYAYVICGFFKFIINEINNGNDEFLELKDKGLKGLNWNHGSAFLRYSRDILGNKYETLKGKQDAIIALYDYLIELNVLGEDVTLRKTLHINEHGKAKEVSVSPFKSGLNKVHFGQREKPDKIKNLESRLQNIFFNICDEVAPDIKLGLYLQFMGGLRAGEVVNLTIDALDIDRENEELYVDIRDRQGYLFEGRNVRLDSSQVKKTRSNQIVLNPNGDLIDIVDEHLKFISEIKEKSNSKYKNALFINKKGEPMTGDNYSDRFYKVKRAFLEKLQEVSYSDYLELKNTKWGTHIGRGIFTNFAVDEGLADSPTGVPMPRVLADLRGDTSSKSAEAYIDERTRIKNVRDKISNLRNEIQNNL